MVQCASTYLKRSNIYGACKLETQRTVLLYVCDLNSSMLYDKPDFFGVVRCKRTGEREFEQYQIEKVETWNRNKIIVKRMDYIVKQLQ